MGLRIATKNYTCTKCHKPIKKGEKYRYRGSLGEEAEEEYGELAGEITICMECEAISDEQYDAITKAGSNVPLDARPQQALDVNGSKWGNRIALLIVIIFFLCLAAIIAAAFGVPIPIGGGGHLFGPP